MHPGLRPSSSRGRHGNLDFGFLPHNSNVSTGRLNLLFYSVFGIIKTNGLGTSQPPMEIPSIKLRATILFAPPLSIGEPSTRK